MSDWYFSRGSDRCGPLDDASAIAYARANRDAWAWRAGMEQWQPVGALPALAAAFATDAGLAAPPPPPPAGTASPWGAARRQRSDEVDFRLVGNDTQFVEIQLDPGESVVAEAGAMMYKDRSVEMTTVFGDGSGQEGGGMFGKLLSAGKRLVTGESLFTTVFTHTGSGKAHVAFAAPFPGTILAVDLSQVGGRLICQKDSFLAAAKGVSLGIWFQRKVLTGLFGGEGFIMQKLEGDGWAFIHMGGTTVCRELAPGETLHVDTGCIAALTDTVTMDVVKAGGIKTMLFGGEGLFFATLTGPGRVWLQSLPFSRLAGRMLAAAPVNGGSKGEGSVLGSVGNLFNGDNSR
ncbi:AIM24 family protein [Caenispirillum bisanense]|uniref:AIM24 family protein n=1 Tax=Caenispirillum bisanense TaxID=414052 RepID=UPI0031D9E347